MPDFTDILGIMSAVRARLGGPPNLRNLHLVITIQQQFRMYRTFLKLTDQNYFILEAPITIGANQLDVPVSAANYKKVIAVEWINPSYPNDQGIDIQVVNFTDLRLVPIQVPRIPDYWNMSQGLMDSIPHAISFRGLPPNMIARATPQSAMNTSLKMYYQPASSTMYDVDGNLNFPSEFTNLIEIATAVALIPVCYSKDINQFNAYRQTLSPELKKLEDYYKWDNLQNKQQAPRASRGYSPPSNGGYGRWGGR